ncbi:MAG TPA: hypothetical protein VF306_14240 [Pirellulales bacterium]
MSISSLVDRWHFIKQPARDSDDLNVPCLNYSGDNRSQRWYAGRSK